VNFQQINILSFCKKVFGYLRENAIYTFVDLVFKLLFVEKLVA